MMDAYGTIQRLSAERNDAAACLAKVQNEADKLRAVLEAVHIGENDGKWRIFIHHGEECITLDISMIMNTASAIYVIDGWRKLRDKALGTWRPEPEEGYEVKTAEEMRGKPMPKGTYIWHKGSRIKSTRDGQIIEPLDEIQFFEIPIVEKEPDTFADIFYSHAEAFCYLCKHVTDTAGDIDKRATVQVYDPTLKTWYDIRIGQAMMMTELGQMDLTHLRFAPKEK